MLQHLLVKNYVLIEHLELIPSPSLSVITGETGAGKSILLTVLGMIMGQRSPSKTLLDEHSKCVMEGTFDIRSYGMEDYFKSQSLPYDPITILRRDLLPTGKSRAYVNDTPVPLDVLRQLGHRLVNVHAQDDTGRLLQKGFQREVLDHYAGHKELLATYQADYARYASATQAYLSLKEAVQKASEGEEYHRYVLDELNQAAFELGEKEELEKKVKRLNHAEQITLRLQEALQLLEGESQSVVQSLAELVRILTQLAGYDKGYESLRARISSLHIEGKDVLETLSSMASEMHISPAEAEKLRSRLDLLYGLQKKHKVNGIEGLLALQEQLTDSLAQLENHDSELSALEARQAKAYEALQASGRALSKARQQQAVPFAQAAAHRLKELGMPQARFEVNIQPTEPHENGLDEVIFSFSANKGFPLRPLGEVASGGERSRLMFVIKYLFAQRSAMPTLVFDEIDAGVSGQVARTMAAMMRQMAEHHQIITVTHLPQFASQADRHFLIYKSDGEKRTHTHVRVLKGEERIKAIAEMIDGHKPSSHALESARNMIEK